MKNKLQKTINALQLIEQQSQTASVLHRIDPRGKLFVTVVFLISMLSVPLGDVLKIGVYFIYPILLSTFAGWSYWTIFKQSLYVLPFVFFIGVFNIIYKSDVFIWIAGVHVSLGFVEFISINLRGLLSAQSVLILVGSTGFYSLCRAMQRLYIPAIFTTQLLFVYRYIVVILQETLMMRRSVLARGFGRRSYPLSLWVVFITQLLIKTFDRAFCLGRAMWARGFDGVLRVEMYNEFHCWQWYDSMYLCMSVLLVVVVRIF